MRATAGSARAGRGGGGRAPCKVLAGACVGATAGPLPPPLIVACVCGRHGGGPWPAAGPAGHRSGESPAARPVQPDKRGGRRAAASAQPRAHRRQRTAATSAPPAAAVAASAPPSPPPPAHRSRQQRRQGWSQWRRQPGAALRTDERPPPPTLRNGSIRRTELPRRHHYRPRPPFDSAPCSLASALAAAARPRRESAS